MKIKITGSRCISCRHYQQHYAFNGRDGFEAINSGQCPYEGTVEPGDKCGRYMEKGNVMTWESMALKMSMNISGVIARREL